MDQYFPEMIVGALKDAIIKVFWKKEEMRALLQRCGVPATSINQQDWNRFKFHIISPIVDALNVTDVGLGPLRRVLNETLSFTDCSHLLWLNDGKQRKAEAEEAVKRLKKMVQEHDATTKRKEEERQTRLQRIAESERGAHFRTKLKDLHKRFLGYFQQPDRQDRGYRFEDILYELFDLFDLNPKGAFRRVGEQIDGAFSLTGDHFLLEAKWQSKQIDLNDLRDLDGAVASSLDNTLGLFVSVHGFSEKGLEGYAQGSRPKLICMDGEDLMLVIEGRIELPDLLLRKKDIAVQKRIVFVRARDILNGKY